MRQFISLLLLVFAILVTIPTFAAADTGDPPMTLHDAEAEPLPVADLEPAFSSDTVFDVTSDQPIALMVPADSEPRAVAALSRSGPDGFQIPESGIRRPADYSRDFVPTRNHPT